jgi:hypothetical protein
MKPRSLDGSDTVQLALVCFIVVYRLCVGLG